MLTFTVPTPPSVNNLFANIPGKGRVKSKRYRIWLNAAGWSVRASQRPPQPLDGPVVVTLQIPTKSRLDIDNACKAPLDLMVAHRIIEDDRQVVELVVKRVRRDDVQITVEAA